MKIDIRQIFTDHLATLRDGSGNRYSFFDLTIFYLVPSLFGFAICFSEFILSNNFSNISITFFGIFVALLLNIQVAIFGIFQRGWTISPDARLAEIQREKLKERRELLKELNANISYLTLLSCFALILCLVVYSLDIKTYLALFLIAFTYSHFILTLLMIVKRAHVLFNKEYEIDG